MKIAIPNPGIRVNRHRCIPSWSPFLAMRCGQKSGGVMAHAVTPPEWDQNII
ncbi:MAG: hypothetical protein LJE84_04630 [Gammaproteobacteria bacterium]|nr:hypothetical protein [Gammaproteobacteria bacterium]